MKKFKFGVALFFSALLVVGTLNLIVPKPTFSETENRELKKAPAFSFAALADGTFIKNYQEYFSDTFLARDFLVDSAAWLRGFKGLSGEDDVFIQMPGDDDPGIAPGGDESEQPVESQGPVESEGASSEQPVESKDTHIDDDDASTQQGILIAGDTALQLYGFVPSTNQRYAAAISQFADKFAGKVQTYNMVVPINTEFYVPKKFANKTSDEKKAIETIYSYMSENVTTLDGYSKLAAHADEYIYFRTDHHWTHLGSYYAYTAFAEKKGFDPVDLSTLKTKQYDDFLGTLYSKVKNDAGGAKLAKNPDTLLAYIPNVNYKSTLYTTKSGLLTPDSYPGTLVATNITAKNKYMCFINGDQPLEKIENKDLNNGKKIVVFKESYGNAFVPWLVNHYQEVYVVDTRYYMYDQLGLQKLIEDNNITEALFLNYVMAPGTPQIVSRMEKLLVS